MFCRVLGLNIPNLKESVQLGVQWTIDNQNPSGGWDYNFDEGGRGGDMSITAWQMQALKAGYHTRLTFRNMPQCISKALNYCEARQNSNGGFGYTGTSPVGGGHFTLTGRSALLPATQGNQPSGRPQGNGLHRQTSPDQLPGRALQSL